MREENNEVDLLQELEGAEAYLSDDIQALAYINEEIMTSRNKNIIDVNFIVNSIDTLIKSMIYNKEQMKNAIDKVYQEKRKSNEMNVVNEIKE